MSFHILLHNSCYSSNFFPIHFKVSLLQCVQVCNTFSCSNRKVKLIKTVNLGYYKNILNQFFSVVMVLQFLSWKMLPGQNQHDINPTSQKVAHLSSICQESTIHKSVFIHLFIGSILYYHLRDYKKCSYKNGSDRMTSWKWQATGDFSSFLLMVNNMSFDKSDRFAYILKNTGHERR